MLIVVIIILVMMIVIVVWVGLIMVLCFINGSKILMVVLVVTLVVFKEMKWVVVSGTTVSSNCACEIDSILLVPLLALI